MSRTSLFILLAALTSGCVPALQPGSIREPDARLPDTYSVPGASVSEAAVPLREQLFADPNLRALIDDALTNNQELLVLGQEVRIRNAEILARRLFAPEGSVYAGTSHGGLICLETGGDDASDWHMWGGNAQHNKTS